MSKLVPLDIPKRDVYVMLAGLKVAQIKAGDDQSWETAQRLDKLHRFLMKQIFHYEEAEDN